MSILSKFIFFPLYAQIYYNDELNFSEVSGDCTASKSAADKS